MECLKEHVDDIPLSSFGTKEIEDVVTYWANRPESSLKKAYSAISCKHLIRLWKHFILWLHKAPAFPWKQPSDFTSVVSATFCV